MDRRIIHVDMDAFYASVEQRDFPELRGKPVVVGGSPNSRGVVAAASYEARKYGIHSAMPASKAVRLCPHLVIQRHRFPIYREISKQIRDIFYSYTPLVEPLSLDEAFLDVTDVFESYGSAQQIGKEIKDQIKAETELTCSVGVAPNKFIAKIASDYDKPDGFYVVSPNKVKAFLADLPVKTIWGVGKASAGKLNEMGVETIHDLRKFELHELIHHFGKWGARLYDLARGIDERPVSPSRESKSMSRETTFDKDIYELSELIEILDRLADRVCEDLKSESLRARTIHIKLRYGDFTTITRSHSLKEAIDNPEIIKEAARLLLTYKVVLDQRGARLIGVGLSNFEVEQQQPSLFDGPDEQAKTDAIFEDLRREIAPDLT